MNHQPNPYPLNYWQHQQMQHQQMAQQGYIKKKGCNCGKKKKMVQPDQQQKHE